MASPTIPIAAQITGRGTSDCRSCGIRETALFADLTEHDFGLIHAPINDLEFATSAVLYGEGQPGTGMKP